MSLVEQELRTLPEHLSSLSIFSRVHISQSLVFCVVFCRSLFVLFLLGIVLSVLLQITASDYPFGIFELFSWYKVENKSYWDNKHSLGIDLQNSKCSKIAVLSPWQVCCPYPNNIVLCVSHITDCLIKVLAIGISLENPIYSLTTLTKEEILDNYRSGSCSCRISNKEEELDLPSLYLINVITNSVILMSLANAPRNLVQNYLLY